MAYAYAKKQSNIDEAGKKLKESCFFLLNPNESIHYDSFPAPTRRLSPQSSSVRPVESLVIIRLTAVYSFVLEDNSYDR